MHLIAQLQFAHRASHFSVRWDLSCAPWATDTNTDAWQTMAAPADMYVLIKRTRLGMFWSSNATEGFLKSSPLGLRLCKQLLLQWRIVLLASGFWTSAVCIPRLHGVNSQTVLTLLFQCIYFITNGLKNFLNCAAVLVRKSALVLLVLKCLRMSPLRNFTKRLR